jgi:DNA repair protein RecN (Recombination protein N)
VVIVSRARARVRRRLHGADRRDRRRQVHPDRRAAAGAGQPRRCRRGARRRGARRGQRRVRHPGRAARLAGRGRLRRRRRHLLLRRSVDARARAGPGSTAARHRGAAARGRRAPGRHPRPACLAEPDPAGRGARPARRQAGIDTTALAAAWHPGAQAQADALDEARAPRSDTLERERERLAWQIGELDKLAPGDGEWDELNGRAPAAGACAGAARRRPRRAATRCRRRAAADAWPAARSTRWRRVALTTPRSRRWLDAAAARRRSCRTPRTRCTPTSAAPSPTPAGWPSWTRGCRPGCRLARRYRRTPAELPALLAQLAAPSWRRSTPPPTWSAGARAGDARKAAWRLPRPDGSALRAPRRAAAGRAVTQAMQQLGMAGGRFEVALLPQAEPQARAWKRWSCAWPAMPAARRARWPRWPRAASCRGWRWRSPSPPRRPPTAAPPTLIFDEIDAGVGGAVADTWAG